MFRAGIGFFAAAAVVGAAGQADAALLLKYEMGQAGPQTQDFVTGSDLAASAGADQLDPNYTGTTYAYELGGSDTGPLLNFNPAMGSDSVAGAQAAAWNEGNYFLFTATVNAGVIDADLGALNMDVVKGGSSGTRGFGVRASVNGNPTIEVLPLTTITDDTYWVPQSLDLSGIASLQNLQAGDVVTFEIAGWVDGHDSRTMRFDNIALTGEAVVPEPASLALLGLGGLCMLRRRHA